MLVEQVDPVSPKPLQRLVDAPNDGLPAAVYLPGSDRAFEVEAELRRDHNLVADGLERLADELLVGERAVELGGVKERNAAIDGRPDQRDHRFLLGERGVGRGHAHAAEAKRRDLKAVSECSLLHQVSSSRGVSRSVAARACGARIEGTIVGQRRPYLVW